MDIKKSSKANLENDRTSFFLLGMVVALSVFFVCLEWRSEEYLSPDWAGFDNIVIEEDYITVTETPAVEEKKIEQPIVLAPEEPTSQVLEDFEIVEIPEILEAFLDSIALAIQEDKISLDDEIVEPVEDDSIHTKAEIMPEFPGGNSNLVRFLYKNTEYPSVAHKQKIQGRVWYSFVVNEDGHVSDFRLEQGVYYALDEEAERVLKTMPDWTPGTIDGEAVKVKIYLPIVFSL